MYPPDGQDSPCVLVVKSTRYRDLKTGVFGSWQVDEAYALAGGSALDMQIDPATGTITVAGSSLGGNVSVTPRLAGPRDPSVAAPRATATSQAMIALIDFSADPHLAAGGLVHAASFLGGPVAPGEIVTIFGANLGPAALSTAQLDPTGKLSNSIAGTQVLFDGVPAPIVYSSAGQVSAIVPYAVAGKTSTVVTTIYNGGKSSNAIAAPVAGSAPGIFTISGGKGQAAALNQDGNFNSSSNPAPAGSVVVLFATGEGQTSPPGIDGQIATSSFPVPVLPVSVTIGGQAAQVAYGGAAPSEVAGVFQLNVQIPAGTPPGDVPVTVTVGSAASQPGVTIAVK
jgi:uncharacterized protein (TIGR03437 family)